MSNPWTSEVVQTMREMRIQGKSANDIAFHLTETTEIEFTRNMVCGKLWRMGCAPSSYQTQKAVISKKKRTDSRTRTDIPDLPEASCIHLSRLTDAQCHWPQHGAQRLSEAEHYYCGKPATCHGYCSEHSAVVFRQTPQIDLASYVEIA